MTDRMNEQKAREILATWNPGSDKAPANGSSTSYAQGYLQALEDERAKAKGLVEALEYCAVEPEHLRPESNRQCAVAKNALARYRNSPGKNSPS